MNIHQFHLLSHDQASLMKGGSRSMKPNDHSFAAAAAAAATAANHSSSGGNQLLPPQPMVAEDDNLFPNLIGNESTELLNKINGFHLQTPTSQSSAVFQSPHYVNNTIVTPNNGFTNEHQVLKTPTSINSSNSMHQPPISFPQQVLTFNQSPVVVSPSNGNHIAGNKATLRSGTLSTVPELSNQHLLQHEYLIQSQKQNQKNMVAAAAAAAAANTAPPLTSTTLPLHSTPIKTKAKKQNQSPSKLKQQTKKTTPKLQLKKSMSSIQKTKSYSKLPTASSHVSKENLNELLRDEIIRNPPPSKNNNFTFVSNSSDVSSSSPPSFQFDKSLSLTPDDFLSFANDSHDSIISNNFNLETINPNPIHQDHNNNGITIDDILKDIPFAELKSPLNLSSHNSIQFDGNNSINATVAKDEYEADDDATEPDESLISAMMDLNDEQEVDTSLVNFDLPNLSPTQQIDPPVTGLGLSYEFDNLFDKSLSETNIPQSSPKAPGVFRNPNFGNTKTYKNTTSFSNTDSDLYKNNINPPSNRRQLATNATSKSSTPNKVLKKAQSFTGSFNANTNSISSARRSSSALNSSSPQFSLEDCCKEISIKTNPVNNYSFVYENSSQKKVNGERPKMKKANTTAVSSNTPLTQRKTSINLTHSDDAGKDGKRVLKNMESGMVYFQVDLKNGQ